MDENVDGYWDLNVDMVIDVYKEVGVVVDIWRWILMWRI